MADEQNIPAPPSGEIVDTPPSGGENQIPPPPSGSIVNSQPAPTDQSQPSGVLDQLGRAVTNTYHSAMGEPEKVQPAGRGVVGGLSELASGVAGLPNQVYHAFTDQPTNPEEAELYNKMHAGATDNAGDPGAVKASALEVPAHLALAYKRMVTDGVVESYNKARRLEQLAEKEHDPKRKKALLDAAGVYGTANYKDNASFRDNLLTTLMHPGAGIGMVPVIGPIAAKMAETGEYGDLEKGEKADPGKALASGIGMALIPKAYEETKGLVKGGIDTGLTKAVKSKLAPTTEQVGETNVPVRGTTALAKAAQTTVPDTMRKFAVEKTGSAVAKGIGETARDAAGLEKGVFNENEAAPTQHDRMGIRGVADDVKARSQATFQKLDELSDNALSNAQQEADDASGDYSKEGRKAYREAMDKQDAIFDQYKDHPEMADKNLDAAKNDWRQQGALREISKKLAGATESSETGTQDYQFKQGKQLSEAVDSLVKNDKDVLQRAGFSDEHIDQLQKFGRIIRQQANVPRFSNYMGGVAKILSGLVGFHAGGVLGVAEGIASETLMQKAGGWMADRLLGKALTTPKALETLTDGFKNGKSAAAVTEQMKKDIAASDPSWGTKMGATIADLIKGESGELNIPGTGGAGAGAGTAIAKEPTPSVSYEHDSTGKFGNQDHMVTTSDERGNIMGQLTAQDTASGIVTVRSNQIYDTANRGKGYGKAQLERLISEASDSGAKSVKSDISTTGDAQNVWKSLEKKYPDAVTKKVYKDGKPQWTVNMKAFKEAANIVAGSADDALAASANRKSKEFQPVEHAEYAKAVAANPEAATLTDPESMTNNKAYSNGEGVYYSISPEGDLQGVINNSGKKGALAKVMPEAIRNGAKSLDAWDIYLPKQYEKYGFERTEKVPYDVKQFGEPSDDLKDAWRKQGWKDGQEYPGVQYMKMKDASELNAGTGLRVGQRKPTSTKTSQGHNPNLNLGLDTVKQAGEIRPEYLQELADKIKDLPGMNFMPEGDESFHPANFDKEANIEPKKMLDSFVQQAADNIEWLHNQTPRYIRQAAKEWYDTAHKITKAQANEFGVSHSQAAAVTAVLSPQNPWDNNISLAKRVMDVYKNKQNFKWSPEMNHKAAELYNQSEAIGKYTDMVRGKKLSQLKDENPDVQLAMKAMWTRIYDEAHNPRTFERYSPDGSTRGIARNYLNGAPTNSAWFSLLPISKAISVLEDGSMDNIHEQLGNNHKVRNFYNNIIDPNSKMGDTTVDTHAVGVAHLSPMGLQDPAVVANFNGPKNAAHGLVGTYPLYAEAYRVAANRLGMLPRQLQSITWEGVRSLFKDKPPEVQSAVRDIWKEHKDGNITLDEARKRIVKAAGGFHPTDWESDYSSDEKVGSPADSSAISGNGLSQEKPQDIARGRSGTARGVSASGSLQKSYALVRGAKK